MPMREMLFRAAVLALCAALSFAPGGVRAAMPDEAFSVLCGEGAGEQVKRALAEGANAMARDEDGIPALVNAALGQDESVIRALLAAGADVNVGDRGGYTALMAAASGNEAPVVRALLSAGAKVNARDHTDACALMLAAGRNHPEIVALLLEAGADKSLTDALGHDALWHARNPEENAAAGDRAAVIRLLEGGAPKPPTGRQSQPTENTP